MPLLVFLLKFPVKRAAATSLAAIFLTAIAGVIGYAINDGVVWLAAILLSAGSTIGAYIGARLLQVISQQLIMWIYVVILVILAARMFFPTVETADRFAPNSLVLIGLFFVGLIAGVMAGLLGVGGGIMVVPILIALFGLASFAAKGTSLVMQIPAAIVGTLTNMKFGMVDLKAAAVIGIIAAVVSYLGVATALVMPSWLANLLFAAIMLYTAGQFTVRALRSRRQS